MMAPVLVDAGPLFAIFSERDQHHHQCVQQLLELPKPLLTCWPVLAEALWLMQHQPRGVNRLLLSFGSGGWLRLLEMGEGALPWIAGFLQRYHKLSPQLADAALVYLAERERIQTIFTLDRRDFSVYRLKGNRSLKLLPRTLSDR